jgi:hypothetical protein
LSAPYVATRFSKELEDWLSPLRGGSSAALRASMFSVESSPTAAVEPCLEGGVRARENRRVDQDSLNAAPNPQKARVVKLPARSKLGSNRNLKQGAMERDLNSEEG